MLPGPWFYGILAFILSITRILHVGLYILAKNPVHPFLNSMFEALIMRFNLFCNGDVFAIYCFGLTCVVKINDKLGLKFLFVFNAYRMGTRRDNNDGFALQYRLNHALVLWRWPNLCSATLWRNMPKIPPRLKCSRSTPTTKKNIGVMFRKDVFPAIFVAFSCASMVFYSFKGYLAGSHKQTKGRH